MVQVMVCGCVATATGAETSITSTDTIKKQSFMISSSSYVDPNLQNEIRASLCQLPSGTSVCFHPRMHASSRRWHHRKDRQQFLMLLTSWLGRAHRSLFPEGQIALCKVALNWPLLLRM